MSGRPRVAIVDTGSGNLRSVGKALAAAGADAVVTSDPDEVARAARVVMPGQGRIGPCVAGLDAAGGAMRQAVLAAIAAGTPYLGICLGLQVLMDGSDEDPSCRGLGLIPGRVVRFPAGPHKIPHMGWNTVARRPAAVIGADAGSSVVAQTLAGTPDETAFYFVHSYFAAPSDPAHVALSCTHAVTFCAAAGKDNVLGVQFHPEKSQAAGLALLRRFVGHVP